MLNLNKLLFNHKIVSLIWLNLILIDLLNGFQIDSSCKCVIFNSTYGKDYGLFHSPNWPIPYEDDINCLLYTFQGQDDQIVEITFDEFDLQKNNLDCIYRDYIQLFLNVPDNLLHDNSSHNHLLCGRLSDIEQTHYSSHSSLIFKFHTDWRSDNSSGFYGTFRFLNKRIFQTDGQLVEGTNCDYTFNNTELNRQKGKWFSPQYPSTYPKNSKCKYTFIAREDEYVKIVIEYLNLQKQDLICLNSLDHLEIRDGLTRKDTVIGLLCGVNSFFEFKSTQNKLSVQFISRSLIPSQGFRASYFFEPINTLLPNQLINNNEIDQNYLFTEGITERTNETEFGSSSLVKGRSFFSKFTYPFF